MLRNSQTVAFLLATTLLASGCAQTLAELRGVGNPPPLAKVENPDTKPDYSPLTMPMPETAPPQRQYANSLWQAGSRTFFRDQRASRVGDILKVRININDQAQIQNNTERKRQGTDQVSAPSVFGLQNKLMGFIPGSASTSTSPALNATSTTDSKGTGTIQRKEQVTTAVPATITQVLPNGNFVIDGKQEMLINYDIREVSIKGVVRPEDIHSDNTVDSTQVAEARITYGGHGQLMDVQQPRWGSQVVETLSPF